MKWIEIQKLKCRSKWRDGGNTNTGCSTRSSLWLWWTTNKTSPTIVKSPKSAQIQCENLRRTGRRKSAGRRLIFHGLLRPNSTRNHKSEPTHLPDSIKKVKNPPPYRWLGSLEPVAPLISIKSIHPLLQCIEIINNAHLFIQSKNSREGKESVPRIRIRISPTGPRLIRVRLICMS